MKLLALPILASAAHAALQYVGADWTSVIVEERAGIQYTDTSGAVKPLEQILAANGVDTVRQRIWVNPANGDYNLEYNLELARRAKAAGLAVYLDFHYSDNWADPGKQWAPRHVCDAFQKIGVAPNIISIGNEIRSGLLWPTGRTDNFANIATLLKAASKAVKESTLSPKPKIMIHLDNGWNWGQQEWWYTNVLKAGLSLNDFDQMGVSFYPFYGQDATLASLRSSLQNMAKTWGKEIVVAEINWPQQCSKPASPFPADLRDVALSWQGQVEFVKRVADIVASTPKGTGLFYWEPAWMNNAGLGSSCESNTMFQWPGKALESMKVFGQI
ncbi:unnamed protein product [Parascedosporium putredinis]|uniref:Arabinogalactan endo-beta-1,4-galactanase n=1 Tax=Parascedosporium putredinis TaxID=1442378 RepID=A0A9P1M931_9PEZI|nr:unnamed protein product [Parascedosporium putredinis]CAI7991230.1 unnamed protein product [Parascedosporium putredinis]